LRAVCRLRIEAPARIVSVNSTNGANRKNPISSRLTIRIGPRSQLAKKCP